MGRISGKCDVELETHTLAVDIWRRGPVLTLEMLAFVPSHSSSMILPVWSKRKFDLLERVEVEVAAAALA